jgi:2-phospho-L-lactate guanylyltransferase
VNGEAGQDLRWWIVVPMKRIDQAKSRIGRSQGDRRRLAVMMARDTLDAAVNARSVAGALVVCQRAEDVESFVLPGVRVLACPGLQINEAISAGVEVLRADVPMANVASLPGDLPYLSSAELDGALSQAAHAPRAVVGDKEARGTTLLTARGGTDLAPAYGPSSLRRHQDSGAIELRLPPSSGIRRDVDTMSDLVPSESLGRRTRAVIHTVRQPDGSEMPA